MERNIPLLIALQKLSVFLMLFGHHVFEQAHGGDVNCNMRKDSFCICDLVDNSGYLDFTQLSKKDSTPFFKDYKSGGWVYSWNPCFPFAEGDCKTDVAVCQSSKFVGARQKGVVCTVSGTNPLKGTLTYGGGDNYAGKPRTAVITFQCDENTDHDFVAHGENPRGHYLMTLTSKYACLNKPPPTKQPPQTSQPAPPDPTTSPHSGLTPKDNAISLGTILDVCVLFLIVTYMAAGTSFMYFRRGERGRKVVPNYSFWVGFPGLVKDGCLLVVHKVKSYRGGASGGYEQL